MYDYHQAMKETVTTAMNRDDNRAIVIRYIEDGELRDPRNLAEELTRIMAQDPEVTALVPSDTARERVWANLELASIAAARQGGFELEPEKLDRMIRYYVLGTTIIDFIAELRDDPQAFL